MKKKQKKIDSREDGKTPTGIRIFDEITKGGLPSGETTLIFGGPGSGKTVFTLETLVRGAGRYNEPGILVSFEEDPKTIRKQARGFGWDLDNLERSGKLFLYDARLAPETVYAGAFNLQGLLAGIQAKAEEIGAKRIVFDALDVLLFLLNDQNRERQETYRISNWLSETNMTGIITVRSDLEGILSPRLEYILFIADCVISLQQTVEEMATVRTLRVIKYRISDFEENPFPFVIGPHGLEIASYFWESGKEIPYTKERVSTGVERLDTMLAGGYLRGSSIMITGAPGSAKSSLVGAFAEACCRRGEAVVYISFNEFPEELTGNLKSIGVSLEPYRKSGLLQIYAERPKSTSVEEHWMRISRIVEKSGAKHIIIDPVTALLKAGSALIALSAAERLLYFAKQRGITFLCVNPSFAHGAEPQMESVPREFSTMVDTWIHTSYYIRGGERNRAISIIKSRSTDHSNQVREIIITSKGITLADAYTAAGDVLMGTLRREKEMDEEAERERIRAEMDRKLTALDAEEAELKGKLESAKRQLEVKRAEKEVVTSARKRQEIRWTVRREEMTTLRRRERNESSTAGKSRKREKNGKRGKNEGS